MDCPLSSWLYCMWRGAVTRNYLDDIQMCCLIVYNHQPAPAKTATRTFSINTRPGNKIKQLLSPPWPLGNRYKIEDTCNIWKFLLFNYSRYPSFLSGNLMMEFLPQIYRRIKNMYFEGEIIWHHTPWQYAVIPIEIYKWIIDGTQTDIIKE